MRYCLISWHCKTVSSFKPSLRQHSADNFPNLPMNERKSHCLAGTGRFQNTLSVVLFDSSIEANMWEGRYQFILPVISLNICQTQDPCSFNVSWGLVVNSNHTLLESKGRGKNSIWRIHLLNFNRELRQYSFLSSYFFILLLYKPIWPLESSSETLV